MSSQFEAIGFTVNSAAEAGELWEELLPVSEKIQTANGEYLRWKCSSGAQIWVFTAQGQLVAMTPSFQGRGRVRVGLVNCYPRDPANAEGGLQGWANATEKADAGEYPFVFDSPDFALHGDLHLPQIRTAQISAFAHEIQVFASEEDFNARTLDPQAMRFASKSFVPTGLMKAMQTQEAPLAFAYFIGHVTGAELRENGLTKTQFQWACVETLGGTYDVVAALRLLKGPLQPGNIVAGTFWLCGQIL